MRRAELEAEHRRMDELKRQAEAAKETERQAKYQLALAREDERKQVCVPVYVWCMCVLYCV